MFLLICSGGELFYALSVLRRAALRFFVIATLRGTRHPEPGPARGEEIAGKRWRPEGS